MIIYLDRDQMKVIKGTKIKNEPVQKGTGKGKYLSGVRLTAAGCVILILLSPWVLYLNNYQIENRPELDLELDHYIREVVNDLKNFVNSNATELLQENSIFYLDHTQFQENLNDNMENILDSKYRPYKVRDKNIEITVDYCNIDVQPLYRNTNDLVRYPSVTHDEPNKLETNVVGRYYDTSVPFSYLLNGDLQLFAKNMKNDNSGDDKNSRASEQRVLAFEEILQVPHMFMEYKLQQFQNQAQTSYSDLGRMTKYMLTTLARMRVFNKGIFGTGQSHKNIINEGDVELALNLAILLEEALLFGVYDSSAANAIDNFYFYANEAALRDDPTGKRQWGNAEMSNYYDYTSRRAYINNDEDRLLSTLLNKYVNSGYIDPADLFALYIVLDKGPGAINIDTPKDTRTLLNEKYDTKYLMDPRITNDPSDTTNLEFILRLPEPLDNNDERDFTFSGGESGQYQNFKFQVDQEPKYLVLGGDLKVTGLDDPRGWYTTADLREGTRSKGIRSGPGSESELTSKTRTRSLTRTPTVVPERPKDHDYRLEWNLDVKGEFKLDLRTDQDQYKYTSDPLNGNAPHSRVINLDLPVNIHVWFDSDPKIGSVDFLDLNTGKPVVGGWLISTESHVVEYFEDRFWKYLKPAISLGFDEIYSVLPFVLAHQGMEIYDNDNKRYLDNTITNADPLRSNWLTDILLFQARSLDRVLVQTRDGLSNRFDTFMSAYFIDYLNQYREEYDLVNVTDRPQFPYPPLLPWISTLGYEVALNYNSTLKILNITLVHDIGHITLLIDGYGSTPGQLDLVIKSHLDLPGIVQLTTTTTTKTGSKSSGSEHDKPGIFADGVLFDTYKLSTRAYSKPTLTSNTNNNTNEQFFITRAKFGTLFTGAELELPGLFMGPDPDEQNITIMITFMIPESQKDLAPELEERISSLKVKLEAESKAEWPARAKPDRYIRNRIYVSDVLGRMSGELLLWLGASGQGSKLAIDISIFSNNYPDRTNITIYLSEPTSTENFITWLGENGLALILVLCSQNQGTFLTDLANVLTSKNAYLDLADLEKIDLEIYARALQHKIQTEMDISNNILELYQYPGSEAKNLTLIVALPGRAMVEHINGLTLFNDEPQLKEKELETFCQMFYCIEPQNQDLPRTHLLVGTSWMKL